MSSSADSDSEPVGEKRRGERKRDAIPLIALAISASLFVFDAIRYVDYSEIELLPMEQMVFALDETADPNLIMLAPEVSIFNRTSGGYNDALRSARMEVQADGADRLCFSHLAYGVVRIDAGALRERLSAQTSAPTAATPDAPAHSMLDCSQYVECARQGVGKEFVLATLDSALPQSLPAGSVFSARAVFSQDVCDGGQEDPLSFEQFLDLMRGKNVRFRFIVETLNDGVHSTSCVVNFSDRVYAFARREKWATRTCQSGAPPGETILDRAREAVDRLI